MNYYKHKDFIRSVHTLYNGSDKSRQAAILALAIMAKSQESDVFGQKLIFDRLSTLLLKKQASKNYYVYDLKNFRLVIAKDNQDVFFLFAGNQITFDNWYKTESTTIDLEKIRQASTPVSKVSPHPTETITEKPVKPENLATLDSFIQDNPDSIEAKIKHAIDTLLGQSADNQLKVKQSREAIHQYRQAIRDYYALPDQQRTTETVAEFDSKDATQAEADATITSLEGQHKQLIINRVDDAFNLINARELHSSLGATQKLKDEVGFVELKIKYVMELESLLASLGTGIKISKKIEQINAVIHDDQSQEAVDEKSPEETLDVTVKEAKEAPEQELAEALEAA